MAWASLSRLLSRTGALVALRIGGAAGNFAAQLYLARTISAESLGHFFLATSLAVIAAYVASFGYPSVMARFVARYSRGESSRLAFAFAARARRDALMLSFGLTALLAAGSAALIPAQALAWALIAAAPIIPAMTLMRINGSLAMAERRLWVSYIPELLIRPFVLLALFGLGVGLLGLAQPYELVLLFGAAAIVAAIVQQIWIGPRPAGSDDRRLRGAWRRTGSALVLISIVLVLFPDITIAALGPHLPPAELAVFAICVKLAFFLGFLVDAVHELTLVELAHELEGRRASSLDALIGRANLLAFGATAGGVGLLAIFATPLLTAFGPSYAAGAAALPILAATQLVRAASGPVVGLLCLRDEQRGVTLVYLAAVGFLALAFTLVAPTFGLVGAALCCLATFVFMHLALCALLAQRAGIRSDVIHSALTFARSWSGRTGRDTFGPALMLRPTKSEGRSS